MSLQRAVRVTFVVVAVHLAACSPDGIFGGNGNWRPGTAAHSIVVGPLTRSYLLHVPRFRPLTLSGLSGPYSLYLVLHGSSGTGDDIRRVSNMDSLSEAGRFLVAYPNGVRGGGGAYPSDWNVGPNCCGAAGREGIDDLGFLSALIRDVTRHLPVDVKRVYVVGFSDGGKMAHHAACKLSPMIAAIGVVSGSLQDATCVPGRAVPLVAIHGTGDTQVAYFDNALTPPPRPVSGLAAQMPTSIQFWISNNGCSSGSTASQSPSVDRATFTPCTGGEVVFYTIQNGVHAWPGEPAGGPGSAPPMSELKASVVMTQFLTRQYRP
ncbi:MAG: PHB depolymerase family esterase [Gemmatimonadaceae bacterium]